MLEHYLFAKLPYYSQRFHLYSYISLEYDYISEIHCETLYIVWCIPSGMVSKMCNLNNDFLIYPITTIIIVHFK